MLVVIGMMALLAAVVLSASFTTQERVIRAECASNLKQISIATLVYAAENNNYVPLRSWAAAPPNSDVGGNPWQTYEACRMSAYGRRVITQGPYGLGLLFFGKEVADPKIFYCPNIQSGHFAYNCYAEPGWPWPSIPPDYINIGPNPYVLCGYNYYPQPRATDTLSGSSYGTVTLPILRVQIMTFKSPNPGDPTQPPITEPVPLKVTEINPALSEATDELSTFQNLSHKSAGRPVGANAVFGDGHVNFTDVRTHSTKNSQQPFDPNIMGPTQCRWVQPRRGSWVTTPPVSGSS